MAHEERNYCVFLDHRKYNRNQGCRRHDNRYGINGGGSELERWRTDRDFFSYMRRQGDPMALPTLIGCLLFGWFFWNYHPGMWLWRGQMLRRFRRSRW